MLEKGLTGRPKAVELTQRFALIAVESGKPKEVIEPLISCFTNKAPKCRSGAVQVCSMLISDFGTQHFPIKEILKAMHPMFSDVNPQVRKEAQNLCCQCYKYIGGGIKGYLTDLRDVQLAELEKQFETITVGEAPPKQINGFEEVTAQSRKASAVPLTGLSGGGGNNDVDDEAFELLDETPVVPKLPKNFFKTVLDKSLPWQERCNVVNERAIPLLGAPRFRQSDDYHELASMMRQYLIDPQAPLMLLGFKMIQECARGLRGRFAPHAKAYIAPLFDRMKDKKTSVLEHIKTTLEKLIQYHCITFDQCVDEVDQVMGSKSPNQRLFAIRFCDYMLDVLEPSQYGKLGRHMGLLKRMVNDERAENRDAGYALLSKLVNVFGPDSYASVISSMDEKQRVKMQAVLSQSGSALPTPKENATPSLSPAKKIVCEEGADGAPRRRTSSAQVRPPRTRTQSALDSARGSRSARGSMAHPPIKGGEDGISLLSTLPSKVEAGNTMLGLLNGDDTILTLLKSKEWNQRMDGVAKVQKETDTWTPAQCNTNFPYLLVYLKDHPGLREENTFQVFQAVLTLLQSVMTRCADVPLAGCYALVADCTHKLTEPKNKQPCRDVIMEVAGRTSPRFVVRHLGKEAMLVKTPKLLLETNEIISELLTQSASAPEESKIETRPLLAYLKVCLEQNAVPLRVSSVQLLLQLREQVGASVTDTFAASLPLPARSHYDVELQKLGEARVADQLPPQRPKRASSLNVRSATPTFQKRPRQDSTFERKNSTNNIRSASPRGSLANSIATSSGDVPMSLKRILKQIAAEGDWRDRLEAVHEINDYIDSVGGTLPPSSVGPILKALGGRLAESNKNFIVDVLKQISHVAQAGGAEESAPHMRNLLPSVYPYLGDQKLNLRDEAREVVFMGVEIVGIENLLTQLKGPLSSESNVCRQNVLEAMCFGFEQLPVDANVNRNALRLLVPGVIKALMDRLQEVRLAAERVVGFFLPILGDEAFYTVAHTLKPADQQTVIPVLDRLVQATSNLPTGRPIDNEDSEHNTPARKTPRRSMTPRSPQPGGSAPSTPRRASASPVVEGRKSQSEARTPPRQESNPRGHKEVISPGPTTPPQEVPIENEEEEEYSMQEILAGLRSAPTPVALDMCEDFEKHFERDRSCGTGDLMQILVERLFEHTRHLEAELALSLIHCLQIMFMDSSCVKKCRSNLIYRLIGTLFDCLLSEQFSSNESVIKSLNKMILKFILGASTNEVFHGLVSRLTSYSTTYIQTTRKSDFKYIQVTVKCILQLSLKNVSDENIVLCCHDFLLQHPPSAFKNVDDLALRTIKTVLQNSTAQRGATLLDSSLKLVGGPFLVTHFIRASLGEAKEKDPNKTAHEALAEEDSVHHQRASLSPPTRVVVKSSHADPAASHPASQMGSPGKVGTTVHSQPAKTSLTTIFAKCRHQETTAAGFEELYAYIKGHALPDYEENFDTQLSRCSDAFQEHIRRKLLQKYAEDKQKPKDFKLPAALIK
ncbi:hypothetical protein, conserved [Angomonas deanei]|uniref:TOG domain-containing protein n=1 Tax=Angomonas deanei TaxID=59799 RepID=A0A7G2CE69_9TRYP|nr:hypothetical protein, conserved [Angomonas deanei]